MTVLDPEVPFIRVLMVMPRKTIHREVPLHEDYHYVPYSPELEEAWCLLHTETGLFPNVEEARNKLNEMLEENKEAFMSDFVFVVDENNELIGSAGLWSGHDFEEPRQRIHFVSVKEKAQHKKIAQSMLTKLCLTYDAKPGRYPLYLVTQSQSYGAIALYSRLGFTPYLGQYNDHSKEESEKDWQQVTEILRQKVSKH